MVSRRRRGEAALARRADHNAGGRQCLLVSYIPLGFSSEPRPVLRQNCNAKDHARAHNSQNTSRPHIACLLPPDNDACRSATMLCGALRRICGPAVEAEAHKGLQRGPPQQRQRGPPRLCKYTENIKLPSTPAPATSVRAGRRRPVLRGRPRQRHRLQEGRVGPRDAGRTTRAEGKI